MNKSLYFALGTLVGAGAGSAATYFLVKDHFEQIADDKIERYAEHCEERIARLTEGDDDEKEEEVEEPEEKKELDPEEEVISRNAGVKKYHHQLDSISSYGANNIFAKEEKKPKDSKLINDIDEDEFMNNENGYEKQTLDVFLGDDKYMCGVWGYGTDNEDDADRKWGKELPELIGQSHTYEELLSYCKDSEDGIGLAYVKNDELMIDFELVIHDDREDDKD